MGKKYWLTLLCFIYTITLSAQSIRYHGNVGICNAISTDAGIQDLKVSISTTHGIILEEAVTVGLGIGVEYNPYKNKVAVPIFIDSNYRFLKQRSSPFIGLQTGAKWCEEGDSSEAFFVTGYAGWIVKHFSFRIGFENQLKNIHSIEKTGYTAQTVVHSQRIEKYISCGLAYTF